MQISLRNPTASLDEPIRHSRLAMVDMGDNAEVSNVFHGICFSRKQREAAGGAAKLWQRIENRRKIASQKNIQLD
jgi:hypothetical protein